MYKAWSQFSRTCRKSVLPLLRMLWARLLLHGQMCGDFFSTGPTFRFNTTQTLGQLERFELATCPGWPCYRLKTEIGSWPPPPPRPLTGQAVDNLMDGWFNYLLSFYSFLQFGYQLLWLAMIWPYRSTQTWCFFSSHFIAPALVKKLLLTFHASDDTAQKKA